MAHEFVYSQPVKIYFGVGKFAKLGEVLEELGVERCVIACGKHFAPTAKEMQEKDISPVRPRLTPSSASAAAAPSTRRSLPRPSP